MKNGPYILVTAPPEYPGKKYRGKYAYEHHLVYWQNTNLTVPDGHTVHHKNENKLDNRIENLELKTRASHTSDHHKVQYVDASCGTCKKFFKLKPSKFRDRQRQSKSGLIFCSRSCGRYTPAWSIST